MYNSLEINFFFSGFYHFFFHVHPLKGPYFYGLMFILAVYRKPAFLGSGSYNKPEEATADVQ